MESVAGASILDALSIACRRAWERGSSMASSADVLRAIAVRKRVRMPEGFNGWKDTLSLQHEGSSMQYLPSGTAGRIQLECFGTFREAEASVRRRKKLAFDYGLPQWSKQVGAALESALEDATQLRVKYASYVHLLAALLSQGDNDAVRTLQHGGVKAHHVLEESQIRSRIRQSDVPHAPGVLNLVLFGLADGRTPRLVSFGFRTVCRFRFHGISPIGYVLRTEAIRQASRLGCNIVRPVHVLASIAALHEQFVNENREGKSFDFGENSAGATLATWGADYSSIAMRLLGSESAVDDRCLTQLWRTVPGEPEVASTCAKLLQNANRLAQATPQYSMGTNHVLRELVRDPKGEPSRLLTACGVNVDRMILSSSLADS